MESQPPADFFAEFEACAPRLLGYVARHLPPALRPVFDPEDVLQDVYFDAFRGVGTFAPDGPDAPYRFLVTVARHRLCRLLRRHRAAKRGGGWVNQALAGPPDDDASTADLLQQYAASRRSPASSAAAHELLEAVGRSVKALPADYEKVIRLRHLEGLSNRETAAAMGRTEGAVEVLCTRALRRLREAMASAPLCP